MSKVFFKHSSKGIECWHNRDEKPINNCKMHTHDCIEIYHFISGECSYLVEGTLYSLKPGDIMIMRPLEAHKCIVNSSDTPYERIGFEVDPEIFNELDEGKELFKEMYERPLGTANKFTAQDFGHNMCIELYNSIIMQPEKITRIELIARTLFILSEAKSVMARNNNITRSTDIGAKLIDYVNQNLFTSPTLEQISNEFFISQSQINRIFRQKTGSSIGQYITAKRLLTARNRIRAGETASVACVECGYNDYSAFYRAYVKRFGISPQKDR